MKTLTFVLLMIVSFLGADEGMWPLNMIPKEQICEKYGAELSDDWLEHVQKSCLRISAGGSASFVSSQGLVMTNHHVGSQAIYDQSTEAQDLMAEGFYARSQDQELKCSNLYADQLISIQDVTDRVNGGMREGMSTSAREEARKEAIALIEQEALKETGLQPQVVTLYKGARYHLYLYKRYTDLRLVMCPEASIAAFGGDIENFEFPRHALDMCFFRVYEEDRPLQPEHYLEWSVSGPEMDEPLFVMGHPGRTERILTAAHLSFSRDYEIPLILQFIEEKIACLDAFGNGDEENQRIASQLMHRYQNAYKVYRAFDHGLQTSPLISNKRESQQTFDLEACQTLERVFEEGKTIYPEYFALEKMDGHYCKMFAWAKALVRVHGEKEKPNEKRLKEYTDSELPFLELKLLTTEPVYPNLEAALLANSFVRLTQILGEDHPAIQVAFSGKSAEEIVQKSQLADLEYRTRLYENPEEVQNSTDPLILLAKALDPHSRAARETYENEMIAVQKESYATITQELFDQLGDTLYPDATFTLRLSIGSMLGYEDEGTFITPRTTIGTLFDKVCDEPPFALPPSWQKKEDSLDPQVPFNFVSTNDIIGGNSGSPVVNQEGEVVGLIFDGNRHSFLWDYEFDETQGRAISVHSAVILHSLKHVYGADSLVDEILH